jgi:hypothetical protein
MLKFLEKAFIRETEEFVTYNQKTIKESRTYNIVDGMFEIGSAIRELADAVRSLTPKSYDG